MTDSSEFIKAWNESKTVGEVAEKLNVSYMSATSRAWRLRKAGHNVPPKYNDQAFMAKISKKGHAVRYGKKSND